MVLLGVQNGADAACMRMVNIEWRPFRKPSRIIFRILITPEVRFWMERTDRFVFFSNARENMMDFSGAVT